MESIDDITRRLCLLYPWSRECQGVAPIEPSPGESAGIWNGPGGLEYVTSAKNIPDGSKCEAVQLVPLDAIGKRHSVGGGGVTPPNIVEFQFPQNVVGRSISGETLLAAGTFRKPTTLSRIEIKNFLCPLSISNCLCTPPR
jgi:hypothetical protein